MGQWHQAFSIKHMICPDISLAIGFYPCAFGLTLFALRFYPWAFIVGHLASGFQLWAFSLVIFCLGFLGLGF